MPITRTPIIDDSGSGQDGTVLDNAWKQEFYDQIDNALIAPNTWVVRPFNAADYTVAQGSGTWTVTSARFTYVQVDAKTAVLSWFVDGMTIAGSPIALAIQLPFAAGIPVQSTFGYFMAGVSGTGMVEVLIETSVLRLLRDVGGMTWPGGTGYIYGQVILPL
jgi:hypothetical protein